MQKFQEKAHDKNDTANVKPVAVSGSPNTVTKVNFDVLNGYQLVPLLNNLVSLNIPVHGDSGSETLTVLGQICKLETKNRWHEDAMYKNLIKQRGHVPHLTRDADITTGVMNILGAYRPVFKDGKIEYEKMSLPVPPGSGLQISLVQEQDILSIMASERLNCYAYLGHYAGSGTVPAPVYLRHFGDFKLGGNGEAYMGGVFGPSGSGKSVMAATLSALWAGTEDIHGNKPLGMLFLDPQSEFSNNAIATGTGFDFDFHDILSKCTGGKFRPETGVIRLDDLQLSGVEMFVEILKERKFFKVLGVGGPVQSAAEHVADLLTDLQANKTWNPEACWDDINNIQVGAKSFADMFVEAVANAYAVKSREDQRLNFLDVWKTNQKLQSIWDKTSELFRDRHADGSKRVKLETILQETLSHGMVRIIDLNPARISMSKNFMYFIMDFVFSSMRHLLHRKYFDHNPANCLVVIDEASRYIPQDCGDDSKLKSLRENLTYSVKELRKYRCGFLFIAQTVSSIIKEVFKQLHFRIYASGMGIGTDGDYIKDTEGDEAFEAYKTLPNPKLTQKYSFMIGGAILSLGSSSQPMIVEAFDSGHTVLAKNAHLTASAVATAASSGQPKSFEKVKVSDIIGSAGVAERTTSSGHSVQDGGSIYETIDL